MSEFRTRSSSSHSAVKGWTLAAWLLAAGVGLCARSAPATDAAVVRISSPCSEAEAWQIQPKFAKQLPPEMRIFVKGLTPQTDSALRAFSDAFTLRQKTKDPVTQLLADYAIARSLHHASIFGLAAEQFDRIVQAPTSAGKAPIQIAAISCLGQIHRRYSAFTFSNSAMARVPDFFKKGQPNKRELNILYYAVTEQFLNQVKAIDKATPKERGKLAKGLQDTLEKLKGSPPHEAFARGIWAAHEKKAKEAATYFARFVQSEGLTEALESKKDAARLLLARSYYEQGDYPAAIKQLELIDKRANELVPSLVYLASAQLLLEDYPKAIGASLGLQSGSLRETFAPESLMVASMALNELCHFPESLAMVNKFKRQYQNTFFWLRDRNPGGAKAREPLYPLALAFLKGEKPKDAPKDDLDDNVTGAAVPSGTVPPRVGSEWIRSPIFIARQESINHLFRTLRKIPKLVALGKTVQKSDAKAIAETKNELKQKVANARASLKPGEKLPDALNEEIAILRTREAALARLAYALPHFGRAVTGYTTRAQQWQSYLTKQIEIELQALNARMFAEILSVTENYELIEAEIWNGASQDIVWQNAHPEFREMVKSGKLSSERAPAGAGDVYDWGSAGQGLDGTEEVWEDEIGAIQANLQNDCANKEKYMKLQQRR